MRFTITTRKDVGLGADGLLVLAGQGWKNEVAWIDKMLGGALVRALKRQKFTGKAGDLAVVDTHRRAPFDVVVVAATPEDGFKLRKAIHQGVRKAKDTGVRVLAMRARGASAAEVEVYAEALILSSYAFDRYKRREGNRKEIERVVLAVSGRARVAAARRGERIARAVCFARDLVNEPAGVVTPSYLADRAVEISRRSRAVRCEVRGRAWMARQGMGGLLGVARGSHQEPVFIVLRYRGPRARRRVAIVGKGITFDSGGLSLKTADQMVTMKCDMSGAAAVLAVFSALTQLRPEVEVIGVVPATENMPGGAAYKPGDILRMMNGKTVEILNTDAEGRLILADALAYAEREKPDWIVDLATLTGACVIALGDACTAMMSKSADLKTALLEAAAASGERMWELPLLDEYRDTIKSDIADLKNSNYGRDGGAIKAGLFLSEFVQSAPWAHLDIAGPAFLEKEVGWYTKGASGHGVATLLRMLSAFR